LISRKKYEFRSQTIEKLEVEAYDNCKLEHKDQDRAHQDNQDSIDKDYTFEQENQDSTHQDDQEDEDNPLHKAFASLDIIIHQEALIKIILQDTLNNN
jgi:hypothetical protein